MSRVFYLSHPQVKIDPDVPVPRWGLSDLGRARTVTAATRPWTQRLERIVSSDETKAIETAELIAAVRGLAVEVREGLHENDRSATGFLPPPEFEKMADAFFANPQESVRGWERAVDAQARIVAGVMAALEEPGGQGDVLFVGHGGVGTLLQCHVAGWPIARLRDQPPGGGNLFCFERESRALVHGWQAFDA